VIQETNSLYTCVVEPYIGARLHLNFKAIVSQFQEVTQEKTRKNVVINYFEKEWGHEYGRHRR